MAMANCYHLFLQVVAHHFFRGHRRNASSRHFSVQQITQQLSVFSEVEADVSEVLSIVRRDLAGRRVELRMETLFEVDDALQESQRLVGRKRTI